MIEQAIAPSTEEHDKIEGEVEEQLIDILAIETDELNQEIEAFEPLKVADGEKINPFAPKEMLNQVNGSEGNDKAGFTKVVLKRKNGDDHDEGENLGLSSHWDSDKDHHHEHIIEADNKDDKLELEPFL